MRTILHIGTPEDEPYQARLQTLTAGQQVAWKSMLRTPTTIAEIEDAIAASKADVIGIICTNQAFMERVLRAQADFTPPNNRRGLTLDDYQGSWMTTPRRGIPVVVLNPLENLVTVPYATEAARRFVSKLTQPQKFFVPTKFTWEVATPATLPEIHSRWLEHATIISVDIETPVPNPLRTINCVGYAAYFSDTHTTECIVIPFADPFHLEWIRKFNKLPQPKVFQNGLYDNVYFMRFGCPVYNWLYDTQHLFHAMYSEYPKRLDFITAYALRKIRYWKDDGKSGNITDYYRYNAMDCWSTLNSFLALVLLSEPYAIRNYLKEFPLVYPCLHAELEGLRIDQQRLVEVKLLKEKEVEDKSKSFEIMIASKGFNVNSPKQVMALFKVLGVGSLTSTDKANMLKAQAAHPLNNRVLEELVEIRQARKLLSTYFVEEKFWNGRLCYKLNPAGTDTGRLASSESSFWCGLQIQNIPRGDSVKQCIISDSGWLLAEIDKAQSEARCVAYMSGEEKLIQLVESGHDYHSWNASAFFGIPYELIYDEAKGKTLDKTLRDLAKRTNHGANYNMGDTVMLATMGPKAVAKAKITLKLPSYFSLKKVCAHLLGVYEKTYPKVKGLFYDSIIKEIELTGRLTSPRGWTRIFFRKPSRTNKPALNAAVAHGPQNLSVDIINEEFYNVWRASVYDSYYKNGKFVSCQLRDKIRIKAQIHDSILFQYRVEFPDAPKLVYGIMDTTVVIRGADGVTRTMFIPCDISAGKERWSELK
jgi:DNA polymerase I-like protein with 3'-5' exonuclease and polymerase domains